MRNQEKPSRANKRRNDPSKPVEKSTARKPIPQSESFSQPKIKSPRLQSKTKDKAIENSLFLF